MPGVGEVEVCAERVEDLEAGVDSGVERALLEQAGGERVDRLDVGRVDLSQRVVEPSSFGSVGGPTASFGERSADPRAQLAGRLFGEGDRHDVAQLGVVAAHELDDPVDQDPGLAGAGAGLQEERGIKLAEQTVAHGLVRRRAAHRLLGLFARITTNGFTVLRSKRSL